MTEVLWVLAVIGGLGVGFVLASMLFFPDPAPEPDDPPYQRQYEERK